MNIQKISLMAICVFSACCPFSSSASGEGGVGEAFLRADVVAGESGYKFLFEMDENARLAGLKVEWNGISKEVDINIFGEIDNVYIRGLKVAAPTEYFTGKQNHVIVVLPFNAHSAYKGKSSWRQSDVIRLHFVDGEFKVWEKATVDSKDPERRNLSSFRLGGKVEDVGVKQGQQNPYSRFEFVMDSP